jgi:hypothetical protein
MFAYEACCVPTPKVTASASVAEEDCPMKHEDGSTCPMHRAKPKDAPCSMRAACHDDMTGLAAVFAHNGVTRDAFVLLADHSVSASVLPASFGLLHPSASADTPPPKF